jgi:hypothetical protein
MTSVDPFVAVTYDGLPISSGGAHSLGRMSRREAFDRTSQFLATRTEVVDRIDSYFVANDVPDLGRVRQLEHELERRFGTRRGFLQPKPGRIDVESDRIWDALDYLDEIDPQPTNRWGMAPIWFWMSAKVRILDPTTGRPLPGQDPGQYGGVWYAAGVPLGTSDVRLILHNTAQLGINLCITKTDEPALGKIVPWLQQALPCKLSTRHWLGWSATKTGSFRGRRYDPPLWRSGARTT